MGSERMSTRWKKSVFLGLTIALTSRLPLLAAPGDVQSIFVQPQGLDLVLVWTGDATGISSWRVDRMEFLIAGPGFYIPRGLPFQGVDVSASGLAGFNRFAWVDDKVELLRRYCYNVVATTATGGKLTPSSWACLDMGETPLFGQSFLPDDNAGQCRGGFMGHDFVRFGEWTKEIVIDTDNRAGGCYQSFSIVDPSDLLAGLLVRVNFYPDGQGQCDFPGDRVVPINRDLVGAQFSRTYRIDADNRAGGCRQVFSIEGRNDIALDVEFVATAGGKAGQCGNAGSHTAFLGQPVQIRIDTDGRAGGCRQKLRLRRKT